MKFKRYAVLAALGAVAMVGLTRPAAAQNYRAAFTLPFEAHWGAVDLQPGDYTVTVSTVGALPVLHVAGNGSTVSILAGPVTMREASDKGGRIELQQVNGTQVVTRYVAANAGREFQFAIPKSLTKGGMGTVALKKAVIPVSSAQ